MCDVCKAEGRDFRLSCGLHAVTREAKIYRAFVGKVITVKVCRICDIQLFKLGEMRFLQNNVQFSHHLVSTRSRRPALVY